VDCHDILRLESASMNSTWKFAVIFLFASLLGISVGGCGGDEPVVPESIESNEPPPNPAEEPVLPEEGP